MFYSLLGARVGDRPAVGVQPDYRDFVATFCREAVRRMADLDLGGPAATPRAQRGVHNDAVAVQRHLRGMIYESAHGNHRGLRRDGIFCFTFKGTIVGR